MNHPSEQTIEQLVINPQSLEVNEIDDVKRHLEECAECRDIYNWLKDFYFEWHKFSSSSISVPEQVTSFVNQIFTEDPYVIELKPLINFPKREGHGSRLVVLAAQSVRKGHDRFNLVATFVSEEKKVLLRILEDQHTGLLNLFVIRQVGEKQGIALIHIPSLNLELLTNAKGKVSFKPTQKITAENWEQITAFLYLPIARISLDLGTDHNRHREWQMELEKFTVHITIQDDLFSVRISNLSKELKQISKVVLESSGGKNQILHLSENRGSGQLSLEGEVLNLRFFK